MSLQRNNTRISKDLYHCNIHNMNFNLEDEFYKAGYGCSQCAIEHIIASEPEKKTLLYRIEITIDDRKYWKIGITTKSVARRYTAIDKKNFTKIEQWVYDTRASALTKESHIKKKYKAHLHTEQRILHGASLTEVFDICPEI